MEQMDNTQSDVTGWVGWIVFAAVMLVMLGVFSIIGGLIAIFDDTWGNTTAEIGSYANSTRNTWGWTTLILGVITLLAAFGILQGKTWALIVAVAISAVVAVDHFTTVKLYPIWSMIVVVMAIFVIYALIVHGKELKTE
jgi:uncharacterized membrane protein